MLKQIRTIVDGLAGELIILIPAIILVLLGAIVLIASFLLVRQYIHRKSLAREVRERQRYNDLLLDCLFSSDRNISEKCAVSGHHGRQFIYGSVIYMMQNFKGEFSGKLKTLFYDLHLDRILLKKLRSRKWWVVAAGLREARIMGFKEAEGYAEKHINARRLELRVEAQICVMSLNAIDPYEFLKQLKKPFSFWARINLYQEITRWEKKPDATRWLELENPGVLVFALRLMSILRQRGDEEMVARLINHDDPMVRGEVAWYAAVLLERDIWQKAAMKYKTETVAVRKKLGQTSGMLPDVPLKLLINWFNWETATMVKVELARSILIHGQVDVLKQTELDALGLVVA